MTPPPSPLASGGSDPGNGGATVALVTGATKGLGREIARQLASRGMTVLASARTDSRGRENAEELCSDGADVRFLTLDVTDQASIAAAARYIAGEFGRLDVLVNNAGVNLEGRQPPSQTTADLFRATYEVNVIGVIAVTHAMLPLLLRSRAGRIVNMSSTMGSLTQLADPNNPMARMGLLAYNSSKAALNAITLLYANELRETSIKVNAASPGFVDTDLTRHTGRLTVQEGATIPVRLATLPNDGPTGAFISENGTPYGETAPW